MHHTARTAPGTSTARPPAVAVLAAVVLALLATLGTAGPPPGTTGEPAVGAAAAGHHRDTGPRADDGCDSACTAQAATRQESHSEHPAPRGPLAACGQGTGVTPPRSARLPAPTGHIPSSGPYAPHDRERAPPATSGT